MLPSFQTIQVGDGGGSETSRFQDNVEKAIGPVLRIRMLDGVRVNGVLLTAGQNTIVSHGLGKTGAGGWFTVRIQGGAFAAYETTGDANTVTLHATSTATVDLWFFR